ncbi:phosphoketolase family protein [Alkalimarinus alittae]|uniref:Xylulose 5-phosphate 3-epimerase n=1 Tax=Alkalimarinus alittae TaxID=2961619 RepID=A0ABY6MXF6_9ALTE|nr:xylulose 5-phosphate 3-epimerase [Alkalimarinus alittae]UZE94514.1 xylulose 5-phosphate 3-epimerase [Alkalimarinus alittae]
MFPVNEEDLHRLQQRAALYRNSNAVFARWAKGYGVICHSDITQVRVFDLCQQLICSGRYERLEDVLAVFEAADRITSAAMWLVVHMTYANSVYLDGRPLSNVDFKENPQGHTGGSLNMVPAYVGYLAANNLEGFTRSWLMGQGHCVAAIDSTNVLLSNLYAEQKQRYSFNDSGLSTLVSDFYSYKVASDGSSGVPLGSHVNANTAGGVIEGGYLGFAELQYVHMPLPGERLVAFLSDGAFEEQRGSDWASRWWRAEDSGLVTPIMIANGRRIDQRSSMYQQGGDEWFYQHLQLNGFHPITIDGRDPAAFIWGVFEAEARLRACSEQVSQGHMQYPIKIPYLIAETDKGYGFYGAATNAAHGAPLPGNPKYDIDSRALFNEHAGNLFVKTEEIEASVNTFNNHESPFRIKEKDHPLSHREVVIKEPNNHTSYAEGSMVSPMAALDEYFCNLVDANPNLRVRVGNPDELRSNRMGATLDKLKHRVTLPEEGVAESVNGAVITALNEEVVISAASGNKGGLNLVVTYEAFAMKMLGALRQEIIFSRHQKEHQRAPGWLSVPVLLTSHAWENGKNEQSHQDPSLSETLWGEMSDTARVLFPADANSAVATLRSVYQTQGNIAALVTPKTEMQSQFTPEDSQQLVERGGSIVKDHPKAEVILTAIGAFQLQEVLKAAARLDDCGLYSRVVYILEPTRFRDPRDVIENTFCQTEDVCTTLFPIHMKVRVFVTHTRPQALKGLLSQVLMKESSVSSRFLGYLNRGGTFDTAGMLFINQCSWAHIVKNAVELSELSLPDYLSSHEIDAIEFKSNPRKVMTFIREREA